MKYIPSISRCLNNITLVFVGRKNIFTCEHLPFKDSAIFNIILPDDNSTLKIKLKKLTN